MLAAKWNTELSINFRLMKVTQLLCSYEWLMLKTPAFQTRCSSQLRVIPVVWLVDSYETSGKRKMFFSPCFALLSN